MDMVAVSIGNAHGTYTAPPNLDMALLDRLREATGIPLVLHGGSGTPEPALAEGIRRGLAKVNVASELVKAVRDTLLQRWRQHETRWVPLAMAESMQALAVVVERWCRITGAAGKA